MSPDRVCFSAFHRTSSLLRLVAVDGNGTLLGAAGTGSHKELPTWRRRFAREESRWAELGLTSPVQPLAPSRWLIFLLFTGTPVPHGPWAPTAGADGSVSEDTRSVIQRLEATWELNDT